MGIFSKIFGRRSAEAKDRPKLTDTEMERIVQIYGAELSKASVGAGIIGDSSMLPFPKRDIKTALEFAIRLTPEGQMREHLKNGYLALADWQDGVGPKPLGLNLQNVDLTGDLQALARQIANPDPRVKAFQEKANAEVLLLQQELERQGLW